MCMHHCRGIMSNMFTMCLTFVNITICMNSSAHIQTHIVCILFNALLFAVRFDLCFDSFMCHKCENRIPKYLLNASIYMHQPTTVLLCALALCVYVCIACEFSPFCHQFTYIYPRIICYSVCVCLCICVLPHFGKRVSSLRAY